MVTAKQVKDLFRGYNNNNERTVNEFIDYVFGIGGKTIDGDLIVTGDITVKGGVFSTITGNGGIASFTKNQDLYTNVFVENQDPGTNASAAFVANSGAVLGAIGALGANYVNPFLAGKAAAIGINTKFLVGSFVDDLILFAGGQSAANESATIRGVDQAFVFSKKMVATGLPVSPVGLESGGLWNNAGVINIVP